MIDLLVGENVHAIFLECNELALRLNSISLCTPKKFTFAACSINLNELMQSNSLSFHNLIELNVIKNVTEKFI